MYMYSTSRKDAIALSLSSIPSRNLASWLRASASFFLSVLCCSLCISSCLDSSPLLLCIISINWAIVSSLAWIACCCASSLELNSSSDLWSINVSFSCRSFSTLKTSNSCWSPSWESPDRELEEEMDGRPVCSCCCRNLSCRSLMLSALCYIQNNNNKNILCESLAAYGTCTCTSKTTGLAKFWTNFTGPAVFFSDMSVSQSHFFERLG